jgi:hypothetical protein
MDWTKEGTTDEVHLPRNKMHSLAVESAWRLTNGGILTAGDGQSFASKSRSRSASFVTRLAVEFTFLVVTVIGKRRSAFGG